MYGDYFNSETRAALAVLKIAEIDFDYVQLNTLANEHRDSKEYLKVNPTGLVPTIVDGNYKILSGNNMQLQYICDTFQTVSTLMYQESSQKTINKHLDFF